MSNLVARPIVFSEVVKGYKLGKGLRVNKDWCKVSFSIAYRLHDKETENKDNNCPSCVITQGLGDVGLLWDFDFFI